MHTSAHWLDELNPAISLDIYRDLAYSHARESGPWSKTLTGFIDRGDFRSLCEFELDYSIEASAFAVKQARQALAYFSKLERLEIGIDKRAVALSKFLEAEEHCKLTNRLLKARRRGEFNLLPRVDSVIHTAQRKIQRVLGSLPPLSDFKFRFGPGATRGVRKAESSIRGKIAETLQCSEDLVPMASAILHELPRLIELHTTDYEVTRVSMSVTPHGDTIIDEWCNLDIQVVDSKVTFQEKNAKTYRAACTEAGLNVIVQLGVGDYIATRLAAFGIDIRDQTVNQRRALEGSLTNGLATIDLSSASDMISTELIYELLPLDWAAFLARSRSSFAILPDGTRIRQEKFSSMGNGYTFPLETLIFWALAASCCNEDCDATVYGDDIIVPVGAYDLLIESLVALGFVPNSRKSFKTGPFRESCGKDYFSGFDVRPVYSKDWVSARSLFVLHNFYVRDDDYTRAKEVESYIHPALRVYGPDGYGDGHLIGDHPRKRSMAQSRKGYSGYTFSTFTTLRKRDVRPRRGDFVLPLYSIYLRGDRSKPSYGWDGLLHRDDIEKYGHRALERFVPEAPLALPNVKISEDVELKELTLPGVDGYKRISIYTLG